MDKKITLTNFKMEDYINSLSAFLDRCDIIGYAAARNIRLLQNGNIEYQNIKLNLLQEYGDTIKDDNGNPTGEYTIDTSNENFNYVKEQLDISGNAEHEVTIFTITYEDVINKLTGNEILEIDWMIESS